jgi:glycosyltransferase involved in cell wall biosynthesis
MSELPSVTVLVPARNEERDIEDCLDAIIQQDYPRDLLEVLVVDGASTDGTAGLAGKILAAAEIRHAVIVNPVATTPSNLNVGLAEADGAILCRVDARSLVPQGYLSRCVEVLQTRPDVIVVGGAQVAVARDSDPAALGVARALNNRWGMGFSRYRRGSASGPADTVYLGAFRTAQVREVGGWDEQFDTNQDYELNRRMGELGTVWFDASLEVGYRPRSSLADLARQYHRFGSWKVRYWRRTGDRPRPRQLILLAGPPLLGLMALVALAVLPRRWAAALIAGCAGLGLVFELQGPTEPRAGAHGHVVGLVASVVIGASWLGGAYVGLLRWLRGQGVERRS